MSRLQKSAWTNLIGITIALIFGVPAFFALTLMGAQGFEYIFFLFVGFGVVLTIKFLRRRKPRETGLDEREELIYERAFIWSVRTFVFFFTCVCTIPFFVLGTQNSIPVYFLPISLFAGLFIAQFVQSTIILIQCAHEDTDGEK